MNLFAPFTLGIKNGGVVAQKSIVEANKDLDIKPHITATDKLITLKLDVTRFKGSDNHPFIYIVTDKELELNPAAFGGNKNPGPVEIFVALIGFGNDLTKIFNIPAGTEIIGSGNINLGMSGVDNKQFIVTIDGPKIKPAKDYYLNYLSGSWDGIPDENSTLIIVPNLPFKTADVGQTLEQELDRLSAGDGYMPACWIGLWSGGISVSGCIAQILYTLFFRPTSFLFGLAGMFFDWSFDYSVKDTSYKTAFVVEGWGLVRDFVNLFFIFVLLWIAFSTILNLHGFKTKEMIINVVIIGLLINFSLFITRVIIDTSNITARVFYNGNSIKLKDSNGKEIVRAAGSPIPLSEIIVDKVNPQKLILDASRVGDIRDKGQQGISDAKNKRGISNGTFILVTLLASAVNVIGMLVFLSVGIIFIARVIGLWIAMILVPLTFFSYTVPALQDVDMIGWKKWWPNTLKLAFLAPIFIFFMYLIVKFLGSNFLEINSEGKGNAEFVIAIIVPFVFIIVLMNKAKGLAVKFSGDIGSAVTKVGNTVGGLAIGAGVGVAAMGLRQTVGRGANYLDKKDWLNDAAAGKKGRVAQFLTKTTGLKTLTSKTARGSFDVRQTTAGNAFSKETGMNLNKGASFVGLGTKNTVGGYVGSQQRKVEKEKKFGESLGYNHHQYDDLADEIAAKEDVLAKFKTQKNMTVTDPNGETRVVDRNSSEFKAEVAKQEYDVKGLQKKQERVKTGRQMEYALTQRRKSGKIYDVDKTDKAYKKAKKEAEENPNDPVKQQVWKEAQKYRDDLGNIKKFGHAEKARMRGLGKTLWEGLEGGLKGAAVGAVAGSVVPIIGTAFGAGVGSIAGAIRNMALHSGTTNRQAGNKDFHKEEFKDTYNPGSGTPAHSEPAHEEHPAPGGGDPHDNHGPAH